MDHSPGPGHGNDQEPHVESYTELLLDATAPMPDGIESYNSPGGIDSAWAEPDPHPFAAVDSAVSSSSSQQQQQQEQELVHYSYAPRSDPMWRPMEQQEPTPDTDGLVDSFLDTDYVEQQSNHTIDGLSPGNANTPTTSWPSPCSPVIHGVPIKQHHYQCPQKQQHDAGTAMTLFKPHANWDGVYLSTPASIDGPGSDAPAYSDDSGVGWSVQSQTSIKGESFGSPAYIRGAVDSPVFATAKVEEMTTNSPAYTAPKEDRDLHHHCQQQLVREEAQLQQQGPSKLLQDVKQEQQQKQLQQAPQPQPQPQQQISPQPEQMSQTEPKLEQQQQQPKQEAGEHDDRSDTHIPYAQYIYRALMEKEDHSMELQDLYAWFKQNTNKCKPGERGWMNSIRHNLSMNAGFIKNGTLDAASPQGETPRYTSWTLTPEALKGGVQSTTRYRNKKGSSGSGSDSGSGSHGSNGAGVGNAISNAWPRELPNRLVTAGSNRHHPAAAPSSSPAVVDYGTSRTGGLHATSSRFGPTRVTKPGRTNTGNTSTSSYHVGSGSNRSGGGGGGGAIQQAPMLTPTTAGHHHHHHHLTAAAAVTEGSNLEQYAVPSYGYGNVYVGGGGEPMAASWSSSSASSSPGQDQGLGLNVYPAPPTVDSIYPQMPGYMGYQMTDGGWAMAPAEPLGYQPMVPRHQTPFH